MTRTICGIAAPVAVYGVLAVPIGKIEVQGPPSLAWWLGIVSLVGTSTAGFVFTTKRLSRWQSAAFAIVYYPFVLALSFYVSLIVVGRLYHNFL